MMTARDPPNFRSGDVRPPEAREAGVVLHLEQHVAALAGRLELLETLLGVDDHGAHLPDAERLAVAADTLLAEERGPAVLHLDGQGRHGHHGRHEQHIRRFAIDLEVVADAIVGHARSERPEALPVFDLQIHHLLHLRASWIAEDAARAQRARTELHAPVEPAEHLLGRQDVRRFGREGLAIELSILRAERI